MQYNILEHTRRAWRLVERPEGAADGEGPDLAEISYNIIV